VLWHAAHSIDVWISHHHELNQDFVDGVLAIMVIALASAGAALNSLAAHANHPGHAERYADVAYELAQQCDGIEAAQTFDDLRRRMVVVRRTMLSETSQWFEGMSSSDIEVPT